jgi:integrase
VFINALSQMEAKNAPAGKYADGQGLWLVKRTKAAGKWFVRLSIGGERREMGLGPWPDVSIAEARERAAQARKRVRDGVDPIDERLKQRTKPKRMNFKEALESCFKAKQTELKHGGTAGRWMSPVSLYVLPKIGKIAVEDIDQHILKEMLEPLWHSKSSTAKKALNRVGLTLKHAAALGLPVDLQATMKARILLGKQNAAVEHIPSMIYTDAPVFYQNLCSRTDVSCLALRFLMLTVARTSEVRFARYANLDRNVLTLLPEQTKTGREHRIPLVPEAMKIIELARTATDQELLFPSPRGNALSDAAMSRFMERAGHDARPHGFRATFRTWVEEQTNTPFEVKEACLGHIVDDKVVSAYQRSERLEKRRKLLERWANYLLGSAQSGKRQKAEPSASARGSDIRESG